MASVVCGNGSERSPARRVSSSDAGKGAFLSTKKALTASVQRWFVTASNSSPRSQGRGLRSRPASKSSQKTSPTR
jgi:hypothetical protein